ncbi:MAG: type I-B CRISPR-associated protein Cas7/Cst2/DevR [Ruminococcus sp.]|nr:type I-B CRISPR-associated protein Cas7/Cst2/DevR [Ruminococcus sp.]
MAKNGLTISMIFQAQSANYGEGVGNIAQLKKMSRTNGEVYTYISRQAIRYNIVQQMGIDNTPVDDKQKVVQFSPNTTITDYPEIDLFGYMKTSKNTLIRSAVVRLSNAISLEPYKSDMDFLNNMGLANRSNLPNALASSEIHNSLYAYTITIDLDKVGIDTNGDIEISNEEKANRINSLLDTVQFLYRDIRGRRENMNPIFIIGGVYERKNPYFEDRLKISKKDLNVDILKSIVDSCNDTKENTLVGYINGYFNNDEQIKETLNAQTVSEVFNKLKEEVVQYYA